MDAEEARFAAKQAAKAASRLSFIDEVAREREKARAGRVGAAGFPTAGGTPAHFLRPIEAGLTVCVRKRPLNAQEAREGQYDVLTAGTDGCTMTVHEPKLKFDLTQQVTNHAFTFDRVFGEGCSNDDVYAATLAPLIPGLARGGQVSVFAYGQTGSGKSFTMTSLTERTIRDLFRRFLRSSGGPASGSITATARSGAVAAHTAHTGLASARLLAPASPTRSPAGLSSAEEARDIVVCVSFYELYCSRVYDLLDDRRLLVLREDDQKCVQVVGLTEHATRDIEVVKRLLARGLAARSVGTTRVNAQSSRSHSVLQLLLRDGAAGGALIGKVTLVDLAGSEGAHEAAPPDKVTHTEAAEINKSLLALKECIRAMTVPPSVRGHIPFRGSKLTQILRESFTHPAATTVMVATASPGNASVEHTMNTLRYADRLKGLSGGAGGVGAAAAGGGAASGPAAASAAAAAIARAVRDRPATAGGSTVYYDRALPASPTRGSSGASVAAAPAAASRPLSDNTAGRRVGVLWNGGIEVTPPAPTAAEPAPAPYTSMTTTTTTVAVAPSVTAGAAAAVAAAATASSSRIRRGGGTTVAAAAAASARGVAAAAAASTSAAVAVAAAAAGAGGPAATTAPRSPRRGQPFAWTLTAGARQNEAEAAAAAAAQAVALTIATTAAAPPLPPAGAGSRARPKGGAPPVSGAGAAFAAASKAPAPAASAWDPIPSLLHHDTTVALGPGASSRGTRHTHFHQHHSQQLQQAHESDAGHGWHGGAEAGVAASVASGCGCGDAATPSWMLGATNSATAVTAARLVATDGVTTRHRAAPAGRGAVVLESSDSGVLGATRVGADAVGGPLASSALLTSGVAGSLAYTAAMGLPPSGASDLHTAAVARVNPPTLVPTLYPSAPAVATVSAATAAVVRGAASRATARRGSGSSTGSRGGGGGGGGFTGAARRTAASRSSSPVVPRAPLVVKPVAPPPVPVAAARRGTSATRGVAAPPPVPAVAAWAPATEGASATSSPVTPPRSNAAGGKPLLALPASAVVSPALLMHPAAALGGSDPFATRAKLQHTPIRTKRELLFGEAEAAPAVAVAAAAALPPSVAATPVLTSRSSGDVLGGSDGARAAAKVAVPASAVPTPAPSVPPTPLLLGSGGSFPSVPPPPVPASAPPSPPAFGAAPAVDGGASPSAADVIALIDAQIKQLTALKGRMQGPGEAEASAPAPAPAPAPVAAQLINAAAVVAGRGRSASPAVTAAAAGGRRRSTSHGPAPGTAATAAAVAAGLGLPSAADAGLLLRSLAMPVRGPSPGPELGRPALPKAAPVPAPVSHHQQQQHQQRLPPAAPAAPGGLGGPSKGPQPSPALVASPTRRDKPAKKVVGGAPPAAQPAVQASGGGTAPVAAGAGAGALPPRAGGPGGGGERPVERHHMAVGLPFPIPNPAVATAADPRALLRAATATGPAPVIIRGSEALAVGDLLRQLQSKVGGSGGVHF